MNIFTNLHTRRRSFAKNAGLFIIVLVIALVASGFRKDASQLIKKSRQPFPTYLPQYDDTIPYNIGDTIAQYTSGLDTIYITYAEQIPDSLLEQMWTIPNPYTQMVVEFSHQDAPVNMGTIGINLSDFFKPGHANEIDNDNYNTAPNPWEAVIALAPKTIRVFSGAGSKFMHPLGFYDEVEEENYGGYGYFWKELVPFYDRTELLSGAPMVGAEINFGAIDDELSDGLNVNTECLWILKKFREDFYGFYQKSVAQKEDPIYINQFLDLIEQIETENEYTLDVIYCVNLLTQTASEVLDIIDYFRLYGVNIVGVELGNEVYFEFHNLALGMTDFEHYWEYINGGNYDGAEETALLATLPDFMEEDHDYIGSIKGNSDYWDIQIGLPAQNIPNCGEAYDFPLFDNPEEDEEITEDNAIPVDRDPDPEVVDPCDCFYPDWNLAMVDHYSDVTTVSTYSHYKFDDIIFHFYYTPSNVAGDCTGNTNWRDIMCELHPEYDPLDLTTEELFEYQYEGAWDYVDGGVPSDPDPDLINAFYGITGIPADDLRTGNFKELTRDRIDHTFEEHAIQMLFTHEDDGPETKEVWVTEYNLHDGLRIPDIDYGLNNQAKLTPFSASVTNSFAHAVMLQNWFLWNIKSSYDPNYREGFLTRATLQNMVGPTTIDHMAESDAADQKLLGEISSCTTAVQDPYFVRKATYYAAELWRVINDNNLRYLQTETTMASLNDNLAPTVFIKHSTQELFVFFTNVSDGMRKYFFAPGSLVEDFGGADDFEIILTDDVDGLILDPDQLYSTAGRSALFLISDGYDNCTEAIGQENRFEIRQLDILANAEITCPGPFIAAAYGGVCVEVPATSMGYFIIPFEVSPLRKGNVFDRYSIYPNPASTHFIVQQKNIQDDLVLGMEINIYSVFGNLIQSEIVDEGQIIDISKLPVGVYNVLIKTPGLKPEAEMLVKMK